MNNQHQFGESSKLIKMAFRNCILNQNVVFCGVITPPAISGAVNNYNPTGLATCNTIRLSLSSTATLSGIEAQPNGTVLIITNTSSFTLTVANNNTSSSTNNRFSIGTDLSVTTNKSFTVQYDGNSSRWRVITLL